MRCPVLLKTGKHKGAPCGVRACKRHAHDAHFPQLALAAGVAVRADEADRLWRSDTGEQVMSGEDLADAAGAVVCTGGGCDAVLRPGESCACGSTFEFEVGIAQRSS